MGHEGARLGSSVVSCRRTGGRMLISCAFVAVMATGCSSSHSSGNASGSSAASGTWSEGMLCEQVGYVAAVLQAGTLLSGSNGASITTLDNMSQNLDSSVAATSRSTFLSADHALDQAETSSSFLNDQFAAAPILEPAKQQCVSDGFNSALQYGLSTPVN